MRIPLKIGVWSEEVAWENRAIWLLYDEFGFPSEPVEDLKQFPLLLLSYNKFVENFDKIMDYLGSLGSVIIVCTSSSKRKNETFECDKLFVEFGKQFPIKGACVPDESHILSRFFPKRLVQPQKRKDFLLEARIRAVRILSPAVKVAMNLKALDGSKYPLLVCGKTGRNGKFAIITADENFLSFKDSYWPALVYLAAVEWCLKDKPFVRKWHWPSNKRMTIALTFDFETLSMYRNHQKSLKFCWWSRHLDYVLLGLGMKRILPFLLRRKIPSTWFILGSQAVHTPVLVRKLALNNLVDVEGHGDFHRGIDRNAENFDMEKENVQRERLKRTLEMLRGVSPKKVQGFRAPGLYANVKTLYALEKTGFLWDSSASPQTNYPIKWFFLPYYPVLDWKRMKKLNLIEIPVTEPWERWCPIHGSFHTPVDYLNELLEDFLLMYRVGGMQTLLIHPYEIAARQTWWNAVKIFVDTVRKFEGVTFQACKDIYEQWVKRMKLEIEATYETASKTITMKTKHESPELTLLIYPLKDQEVKLEILSKLEYTLNKGWRDRSTITFRGSN